MNTFGLWNHISFSCYIDTGEKPFTCEYCGVKFRQKDGLKRHVAAKHTTQRTKQHMCDLCGKILLSKYSLNVHRNKHGVPSNESTNKM